jgi:predicted transcriptional regulator
MTIIRAERPHINYTIIKNETLRNNSLSFRARGIHAYLLSMPDNWRTSALQMSRQGQEGRDAILKALQELEDAGFVKRTKSQDARGRWHSEIIVYDECCLTRVEMLWKRRGQEKHRRLKNRLRKIRRLIKNYLLMTLRKNQRHYSRLVR